MDKGLRKKAEKWLDSYPAVSKWMAKYDLEALLEKGGGLARIENFLPDFVAEYMLERLKAVPESKWNETSASRDYTHNNISHAFKSTRTADCLETFVRCITLVKPEALNSFSAARYTKQDHIERHDDRAYTNVLMEDGSIVECSRDVALILYLTKDWKEQYGGLLVDDEAPEGPKPYVPLFNSAVVFRIPRWHTVTPMKTDRPRYTLFGWFLEPGHLYDLQLDPAEASGSQGAAAGAGAGAAAGDGEDEEEGEVGSEGGEDAAAARPAAGQGALGKKKKKKKAAGAGSGQGATGVQGAGKLKKPGAGGEAQQGKKKMMKGAAGKGLASPVEKRGLLEGKQGSGAQQQQQQPAGKKAKKAGSQGGVQVQGQKQPGGGAQVMGKKKEGKQQQKAGTGAPGAGAKGGPAQKAGLGVMKGGVVKKLGKVKKGKGIASGGKGVQKL